MPACHLFLLFIAVCCCLLLPFKIQPFPPLINLPSICHILFFPRLARLSHNEGDGEEGA
jgi:hypothetical protein